MPIQKIRGYMDSQKKLFYEFTLEGLYVSASTACGAGRAWFPIRHKLPSASIGVVPATAYFNAKLAEHLSINV